MKSSLIKKMVGVLLLGGFALSAGAITFANEVQSENMPAPAAVCGIPAPGGREQEIQIHLGQLADNGTITREQADKLIYFFKEKDRQHKAEIEKMQTMTPEKKEKYRQQNFPRQPDMIKELKDAGGLSDEQAKAVDNALRPPHRPDSKDGFCCPMKGPE